MTSREHLVPGEAYDPTFLKPAAGEMNAHMNYYDAKGLWPLFIGAGFRPCKFGWNRFAACGASQ